MATQIFIYDSRNGSSLLYQVASNSVANTSFQWDKIKEHAYILLDNTIRQEINNPSSNLVQINITKG